MQMEVGDLCSRKVGFGKHVYCMVKALCRLKFSRTFKLVRNNIAMYSWKTIYLIPKLPWMKTWIRVWRILVWSLFLRWKLGISPWFKCPKLAKSINSDMNESQYILGCGRAMLSVQSWLATSFGPKAAKPPP